MADEPIRTTQVEQITTDGDVIRLKTVSVADQIAADVHASLKGARVFSIPRRLRRKI